MSDEHLEIPSEIEDGVRSDSATILVGTADAARVLNIAERTVRKHITTNQLTGHKINNAWLVELPRADVEAAGIPIPDVEGDVPPDRPIIATNRTASGNASVPEAAMMEPMADLIASLSNKVAELSATSAMWQERARAVEEQRQQSILALEAGQSDTQRQVNEAREQVHAEWRAKSWWQRLKGE